MNPTTQPTWVVRNETIDESIWCVESSILFHKIRWLNQKNKILFTTNQWSFSSGFSSSSASLVSASFWCWWWWGWRRWRSWNVLWQIQPFSSGWYMLGLQHIFYGISQRHISPPSTIRVERVRWNLNKQCQFIVIRWVELTSVSSTMLQVSPCFLSFFLNMGIPSSSFLFLLKRGTIIYVASWLTKRYLLTNIVE